MLRPVSRREVLTLLSRAGFAATAASMLSSCADTGAIFSEPVWLQPAFTAADLRALGAEYRRQSPGERTVAQVEAALRRSVGAHRRWPWSPAPTARAVVQADFAAGDTLLVNGWLLSRTEARVCAHLDAAG